MDVNFTRLFHSRRYAKVKGSNSSAVGDRAKYNHLFFLCLKMLARFFFMNCRCLFLERPGDDISVPRYILSNLFIYGLVTNFNTHFIFSVSEYFCNNLKFSFLMDKDEDWAYVIGLGFEMFSGVLGN